MAKIKNKNKRQDTPAESDKRDRSWSRGQERKAVRREAQAKREKANIERRSLGELTPWEQAKAARAAARAERRSETP